MVKPYAPRNLGASGRKVWADVLAYADLDPAQLRILEDIARTADLIDDLVTAQKDAPMLVKGSMGQQVASPLISEVRQHRTTLANMVTKLNLDRDAAQSLDAAVAARLAQAEAVTEARTRLRGLRGGASA